MKQNLHTHTTYCDGIDTPEEMVRIALEKGFDSLGFSGHSTNPYSTYTHVTEETTRAYQREILRLKEKYRGQIQIFLGLEVDTYSKTPLVGYDYLIGSVHYLSVDGEVLGFDRSAEAVRELIDGHFGGNALAFAKTYYRQLAQMPNCGSFDVIGHFDILTKNAEKISMFDLEDRTYLRYAAEAMDALQGKIPYFEVNTGAMARGYRTAPYPTEQLLRELKHRGFGAIISSDCHDGRYLDHWFCEAEELLHHCGFRERYCLTAEGFVPVLLQEVAR